VQDHKRAKEDDLGPNTGGMGSYSCEDHLLPFLTADQIDEARQINTEVANALFKETGERYKGILYGGFMATKHGIRVIEYNARFGDPEVMNVLPLLEGDFIDICEAIIGGTLDQVSVGFKQKASVCKYVVPEDYPTNPVRNKKIDTTKLPTNNENLRVFYGAVNSKGGDLYLTGSRALAIVGIGKNLQEAEQIAESAASTIQGPVFHRSDIGTSDLIAKRVNHMRTIRADGSRSVSISNGELNYAV
jgi:fusion protein PurCD